MAGGEVDWVGVAFTPLHHHDARFFRAPGLYAFVRRCPQHGPLMLFAGQAENLAQEATPSHPVWPEALSGLRRCGSGWTSFTYASPSRGGWTACSSCHGSSHACSPS